MLELASLSTADAVLVSIAVTMLLATAGAVLTSLSVAAALGAGSIPAGGSIGYALFCDPPTDG